MKKSIENSPLSRRDFLRTGAAALTYGALETLALPITKELAEHPEHTIVPLLVHDLLPEWNDTVIVLVSDLHISERNVDFFTPDNARQLTTDILKTLISLQANANKVFMMNTGDLVSNRTNTGEESKIEAVQESFEYLKMIPSAGNFIVPGNHDLHYWKQEQLWSICERAGYQVLGLPGAEQFVIRRNDLPFNLVTTTDFTTRNMHDDFSSARVALLENQVREAQQDGKPHIWMTHNASVFDQVLSDSESLMQNTLGLSGHTHGGQIGRNTPLQSAAGYVALRRVGYDSKYISGLYQVGDSGLVGVSWGLGHAGSQAFRTARTQVVYYVLKSASAVA